MNKLSNCLTMVHSMVGMHPKARSGLWLLCAKVCRLGWVGGCLEADTQPSYSFAALKPILPQSYGTYPHRQPGSKVYIVLIHRSKFHMLPFAIELHPSFRQLVGGIKF